jgi:hypothetical protein
MGAKSSDSKTVRITSEMVDAADLELGRSGWLTADEGYPVPISDPIAAYEVIQAALVAGGYVVQNASGWQPVRENRVRSRAHAPA